MLAWIGGFFVALFTSLWLGTQRFAAKVQYDPSIGEPWMTDKGIPYYYPWKIIGWYQDIHPVYPDLFNSIYPWMIMPFVVFLVLGLVIR